MATPYQTAWNQTPSKSCSLITKCEDLPLETFIEIVLDGDHSRLGEGDTSAAWAAISTQYGELTGSVGSKAAISLGGELHYLSAKIEIVCRVCDLMLSFYNPRFGKILHAYGVRYEWVLVDAETYEKQIAAVLAKAKFWKVEFLAKKKEYDAAGETKKIDRSYFEDWVIAISKAQGYHVRINELSTYQFARHINQVSKKRKP